jgi:hypothetical protein
MNQCKCNKVKLRKKKNKTTPLQIHTLSFQGKEDNCQV